MEYQPNVRALLELSGYTDELTESKMADIVKGSPDPETAVRSILSIMPIQSTILQNKWRKYICRLWAASHPKGAKGIQIPLTSREVMFAPVLVELYTLVQELLEHPATINKYLDDHFLHASEELRLAVELSSFAGDPLRVRRACALLEELNLVRPYKGKIRIIESRYQTFAALPVPSQFYILWHVDMYHLDWKEYFHEWGAHLVVFQQYLPMVWEMLSQIQVGETQSVDELTLRIVRSFRPLWQQEASVGLYEQSALQASIESWLVDCVFTRYGFITNEDAGLYTWTSSAQTLLELERTSMLPCPTDALL
ncbi:MAG: hypothetical protein AAB649_06930 [Patescibacteria group bacterium]